MDEGSSVLLGLDGVVVEAVSIDDVGVRTVLLGTAAAWVGVCPACGDRASRSKGWVCTRPRDVKVGPGFPRLVWRKRKWLCNNVSCARKVFTESVSQIPARARITGRARAEMAAAVLDDNRSVSGAAAGWGCSWNICQTAVSEMGAAVVAAAPAPTTAIGIDEARRGRAGWRLNPETGQRQWVDRFDTGIVDIVGDGGLIGQFNGRGGQAVIDWIESQTPQWQAGIEYVATDMSAGYARAAREALPHAQSVVDPFHVIKKALRG